MATDPWAGFEPIDAGQPTAGVIAGAPRAPAAPSAAEIRRLELAEQANARAAEAHARTMGRPDRGRGALTDQQRNQLIDQRNALGLLETRINELDQRFNRDFTAPFPLNLGEYIPGAISGTNAAFNDAGRTLLGDLKEAMGMTGGEANTAAEVQLRFGPWIPRSTDTDTQIRAKLVRLRELLANERQSVAAQLGDRVEQQAQPGAPAGELRFNDELPEDTNPLTPGQQRAYDAFLQANPNATPEQINAFTQRAFGLTVQNADAISAAAPGGFAPAAEGRLAPDVSDMRSQEGSLGQSIDAFGRGAADVLSLGFADELAAAGNTLFGDGTMRLNLARERAVDDFDTQNNFAERLTGQLGSSLLIPSRAPAAFSTGGVRAGAAQLGREGAIYGGGYGVGSAEGNIGDRALGGVGGAALGGATGYVAGGTLGALLAPRGAQQLPPRRAEAAAAAQDATDLGIDLNAWDLGGAGTRRLSAIIAQDPFGAGPIAAGNERVLNQAGAARDAIAARAGAVSEPAGMGEAALQGAARFRQSSGNAGRALYNRANQLAEGVDVQPNSLSQTIAQHIANEGQTLGGSPAMPLLQRLADDIAQRGQVTVDGVRGLRTNLRSQLTDAGMTPDNADRIVNDLVRAATDDLGQAFTRAGRPEALQAFQQADQFWAGRLDTIRNTLQPIIGRRGERTGEEVARQLRNNAQGNGTRLGRFISALPEEEASTVRATLAAQLGRSRSGAQNAEGSAFSLDEFLTNWDQIRGSREQIFDRETVNSLSQLARVAGRVKEAGRYSNRSNTGSAVMGAALAGHAIYSPVTVALQALGTFGAGRLLTNPRFARWLARAPNNQRAIPGYTRRLAQIARTEPAIAADIMGLQQHLANSFAQSPVRAAAEEEVDRR